MFTSSDIVVCLFGIVASWSSLGKDLAALIIVFLVTLISKSFATSIIFASCGTHLSARFGAFGPEPLLARLPRSSSRLSPIAIWYSLKKIIFSMLMLPFLFWVVPSLRHNHGVEDRARCLRHKVFTLVCALFAASSAAADRYERFSAWSASMILSFSLITCWWSCILSLDAAIVTVEVALKRELDPHSSVIRSACRTLY